MPVTQTLLCTALPNGVRTVGGQPYLRLSAYLTPRLTGAATLAAFPDWLDWPAAAIEFAVSINNATPVPATKLTTGLRSDLWRQLFLSTAPVTDHTGPDIPPATTYVRSYPASGVRDFVHGQYTLMAANNPTTHPVLTDYFGQPETETRRGRDAGQPVYDLHTTWIPPLQKASAANALRVLLGNNNVLTDVAPADVGLDSQQQLDFLLSEQFHGRDPHDNPGGGHSPQPKAAAPVDFHAVLSALGQYPALLRQLGLVQDLQIPLPNPIPAGTFSVSIVPTWTPTADPSAVQTLPPLLPLTDCQLTATSFVAAARTPLLGGGLLQLGGSDFAVTEIDPDAAALALLRFAESMSRTVLGQHNKSTADSPDSQPPPALRSGGLSINESGRAARVYTAIGQAQQLESGQHVLAEDLTRGVRIDVWDNVTNDWHSLCQRQASYTFAGTTVTATDEGVVTTAATSQPDDTSNTFYLHESLARWTGYSLVAPRPGKAIDNSGGLTAGSGSAPGDDFNLAVASTATPGSLPRLRFGRSYRFRARLADLAGNGLALADPSGDAGATDPVVYARFEPVAAPAVVFRRPRTEGESQELLVIRSNYDTPATADCQRHLAPTRIAELLAEQHGLFDLPATLLTPSQLNKLAYGEISQRDGGSLDQGGTRDQGSYDIPYYDTDQLVLPYLPDVLSRGAAFLGLPGSSDGQVVTVDFDYGLLGAWPDARPFRIRLVEGTGAPSFDALLRVLTVQVAKGRRFDVRYSSRVNADDLPLLGQWSWLADAVADGSVALPAGTTLDSLRGLAAQGQLWLLTPFRTLSLVHAIKQPLTPPTFAKPVAVRLPGQTFATIIDRASFDRASTSKVDLQADWQQWQDLPDQPGPTQVTGSAHAFQILAVSADPTDTELVIDNRHEFHDTRYRRVDYTPIGTSRFTEYFTQRVTVTLTGTTAAVVDKAGIVPGTDVVRSTATPPVSYVRDVDYTVDYLAGTITRLDATIPSGSAVEVAYVPPPVTRAGAVATIDVPSSARPAAPDIAYVVPTFGWQTDTGSSSITSTRQGNGLRVFLHRPWYSSGDGEKLGVLVAGQHEIPADLTRYVTAWAQDPAWQSTGFARQPLVTDFPLAAHPHSGLALAEQQKDPTITDTVSVAPHDVVYDAERGLWYCDITLAPPQPAPYTPFVRLALARYQPISVPGVELSAVVQAQFAQLQPDRALTVVSTDPTHLAVTVTGASYTPVGAGLAATVTAVVQTADPTLTDNVRWTSVGTPVPLSSSVSGGQRIWTTTLPLPAARGSQPLRLVVAEYEQPNSGQPNQGGQRLVYTDAIEL